MVSESTGPADALQERLRGGDESVLAELFALHREQLYRIVSFRLDRRLCGRVDPDDVLQEAYLAAAQRLRHFIGHPSVSFLVWARTIVMQTLIDLHRLHISAQRRDARREVSIGGVAGSESTCASLAAFLVGDITSPSEVAMREESARQLEDALNSMDPIDREVLALRHFELLSNNEVAEILGLQKKAASIRYVRALKRLKTILAERPGFSGPFS